MQSQQVGVDDLALHQVLVGTQRLEIFEIDESIGLFGFTLLQPVFAHFALL